MRSILISQGALYIGRPEYAQHELRKILLLGVTATESY